MCHGLFGISSMVEAPNLAGQPQIYLSEQLKHFKNGSRKHEIMSLIAAQLSDNEIADVSKWYSDIEIFIKKAK
jgi:cytochrome c553